MAVRQSNSFWFRILSSFIRTDNIARSIPYLDDLKLWLSGVFVNQLPEEPFSMSQTATTFFHTVINPHYMVNLKKRNCPDSEHHFGLSDLNYDNNGFDNQ